jgi:hypothetical protein
MAYDLISGAAFAAPWGYPQIVGADADYNALMRAAAGIGRPDSMDMLDRMAIAGIHGGYVGAEVNPSQAMIEQAVAMRMAQQGIVTSTRGPTKAREYPIGFDSGAVLIPNGASVSITNRPQVVFRVERLVIPSDIGGGFVVEDVIVGKNSQFASNTVGLPARVFDERGVGVRLAGDTAQISQDITLKITNVSGAPARFRAAIIGPAVE